MNFKKILLFLLFLIILIPAYADEASVSENETPTIIISDTSEDASLSQPITFTTQRRFSETSPLDVVDFYFYQGDRELTFAEFKEITQDPLLTKTDKMLRTIMINGSVVGSIFGLTFLGTLIPSAILIDKALAYEAVVDEYMFSGIAMIALSAVSVVGIVVDIVVASVMYHRYRYNEPLIRTVVDNYNKKLRQAKVLPDMTFLDDELEFVFKVKI